MGLAMTDELGIIASPYDVLPNGADVYDSIAGVIADKSVGKIIVGLPVTLSGDEGEAAAAARAFAEILTARVAVPVELFDERLTTRAAERAMRESGAGGRERRRGKGAGRGIGRRRRTGVRRAATGVAHEGPHEV